MTQEDEDAVLQELEEMTQVVWHIYWNQLLFCRIQLSSFRLKKSNYIDRDKQNKELMFIPVNKHILPDLVWPWYYVPR